MNLKTHIQQLSTDLFDTVVGMRRYIHQHPELSFKEAETAGYVQKVLTNLGISYDTGVGGHGVVGYIEGKRKGKTIALRADMDALPIHEANDVPYKSQTEGVMHACGHDAHTASLLGTARILSQLKDHIPGTIKLVFQPAEERLPGGASLMIKDGVLKNPEVSSIFGQHVLPYLDCGKIGIRSGAYMASPDEIYMRIIGQGGHAAQPHTFVDPVVATAQIITALQQVVSRSDPRMPSVLSIGKIIANGATNVIPNEVYLEGTFRSMDPQTRVEGHEKIKRTVQGVAEALGVKAELDLKVGYPVLHNDEVLATKTRTWIAEYVGEENVVDLDIWMAGEDFAFYTQEIPGVFYRLGTRNEAKGLTHGLHTPHFDIDEQALKIGPGLMAWLAVKELQTEED